MSTDAFVNFVNLELPKRISTGQDPLNLEPGKIPVSTGIGLSVDFKTPQELELGSGTVSGLAVYTAKRLAIIEGGRALLPHKPIGDFLLNVAIVHLNDGCIVEFIDITLVELEGRFYVQLPIESFTEFSTNAVSVTVSYVADFS